MKNLLKPLGLLLLIVTLSVTSAQAQTINGVLQANPSSLSYTTRIGVPVTKTVTLNVLNQDFLSRLTSPVLEVRLEGTNANQFSIDANTVSIADILKSVATGQPVNIPVTYNPTFRGTHFATLVVGLPRILGTNVVFTNVALQGRN